MTAGPPFRGRSRFSHPASALTLIVLAAVALPALILVLNRLFPGDPTLAGTLATSVLFVVLAATAIAFFLVRVDPALQRRPAIRVLLLVASLGFSFLLFFLTRQTGVPKETAILLNSANLLILALLLGSWMVAPVKRPPELVPVCAMMTAADLFSVFGGPSRGMAMDIAAYYESGRQGPVPAVDFLLCKVAVPGMSALVPVFGVADWIMVVFLAAAASKFGLDDNLAGRGLERMVAAGTTRPYIGVAVVGLLLAILLAQHAGLFLPALPVVAAVYLLYIMLRYPQVRRLRLSDWALVLLAGGVFAGLFIYRSAAV